MNVGEMLLHAVRDHGAKEIFGIPGDFVLAFFKVIEESGILPFYTFSHEPAVGFAADAAARLRCAPAVACVTYGAGALNMVNPIAAAYAEKSPVVVISGSPGSGESRAGLLLHHQARSLDSQFRIYREITCDQAVLDDPATAPDRVARVLASCRRHSRPVYIELPRDQVLAPCRPAVPLPPREVDREAVAACADEILARLAGAASPVLMVGVEIRRYNLEARVAEIARRLGLPVVTSFMGHGLLAGADAPLLGTYLGVAGAPDITRLVEDSDALFLLGVLLSDTNFGISARKIDLRRSIQALDGRVAIGFHSYADVPLEALIDTLLERLPVPTRCALARAASHPRGLAADDGPVTPTDIACAVNDLMARAGRFPIASDVGDCMFTAFEMENTDLVAPGYYAGMGFGVPAGMGVQAATGRRPLVLAGDGAFQMTGWELGNCQRYGWDPIVLVFNNCSWEMLRVFQPESRFNSLDCWPFARIADVLGGRGRRVTIRRELQQALDVAAAERGRFQLVEVMLARGALSPELSRFAEAMKRWRSQPQSSGTETGG